MAAGGRRIWGAGILSALAIAAALGSPKPVLGWPADPSMAGGQRVSCTPGPDWGRTDPSAAARVLVVVNYYRAQSGLPALLPSRALDASAMWKSLHMGRFGYFGHTDPAPPVDRSPFERAVDCGYVNSYIGENIAAGQQTPDAAVRDWMESPGHRAIIESPVYSEAGVGVALSPAGRFYWTLDVGRGPVAGHAVGDPQTASLSR